MCDVVRTGRFKHGPDYLIYGDREDNKQIVVCERCWQDHANSVLDLKTIKVKREVLRDM